MRRMTKKIVLPLLHLWNLRISATLFMGGLFLMLWESSADAGSNDIRSLASLSTSVPEPTSSGSNRLDFEVALQKIVARSTVVSDQEAQLKAMEAKSLGSRFLFLPDITLNAREPITDPSTFFAVPRTLEIRGTFNLFRGGADYFGLHSAIASQEAKKCAVGSAYLQAELQGVEALTGEIQQKKEIEILSEIVGIRTGLLSVANERYDRGYLPIQEVEKLKVDLENARAELMNAEMREADTRALLENLLGHSDVSLVWPWKSDLEAHRFSFLKEEEIREGELPLQQVPTWEEARLRVIAEEERLTQNYRQMYPSVDLYALYGTYTSYFGAMQGWTGAIEARFPIFDAVAAYARAREQAQILTSSQVTLEQVKRDSIAKWKSSQRAFQLSFLSAVARDQNALLSRKLYQDNLRRFKAGKISSNDLAIDQNRVYEAELLSIRGWSLVHTRFTNYCHSLGHRLAECVKKKDP